MEQWNNLIHSLSTFSPNAGGMDFNDNFSISGNLSPLTNLFLNTFVETMNKKNLIVLMPDLILKPIPIVSYIYSKKNQKSTLIFTRRGSTIKNNPQIIHSRNYYLLNWNQDYLFYDIPIGSVSLEGIEADPYIPRALPSVKNTIKERQRKNFLESNKPKILLYYDDKGIKITETINNLILDKSKLKNEVNIDIGCIIFENVDRFIRSKYMADFFIKWLQILLDKKINFIFHFSNPESIFINDIKKATNSLVLPLNFSLIRNNIIKEKSLEYFNDISSSLLEFVGKYNIDNPQFYDDEYYNSENIEIYKPPLKAGNLDYYFRNIFYLDKKINKSLIKNKKLYYKTLKTIYSLMNISINPSKYYFRFIDHERKWYNISLLLNKFSEELIKKDPNELFLSQLVSEFYSVYFELSECDRYYEKGSYERIAKDYKILEIASDNEIFQNDNEIIFATYGTNERSILESEIENLNLNKNIRVFNIDGLNKAYFDRSKYNLVLPGPLPHPYLSELTFTYQKILLLTYEGYNHNRALEQIEVISKYSLEKEINSMRYLEEIYDFIKLTKNNLLFTDFKKRLEDYEYPIGSNENIINPFDIIKKKLIGYKHSREYDKNIDYVEKIILESKDHEDSTISTDELIEIRLKNLNDGNIVTKRLPLGKTYFYLEDLNVEVFQCTPQNLKKGYFVVIIDDDEQKTLLQLIIEIFGLEKSVNKPIIEYWKEALMKFIKEHRLSYKRLHNLYAEAGGTKTYQSILHWVNGSVIGPRDPKDLYFIGKILNDDIILQNCQIMNREIGKIRQIHKINGKRLKKVIKEIVSKDDLDLPGLTKEEYLFYDKVKNGIYEIIEIKE